MNDIRDILEPVEASGSFTPWLIGLGLVLAAGAAFALRRLQHPTAPPSRNVPPEQVFQRQLDWIIGHMPDAGAGWGLETLANATGKFASSMHTETAEACQPLIETIDQKRFAPDDPSIEEVTELVHKAEAILQRTASAPSS